MGLGTLVLARPQLRIEALQRTFRDLLVARLLVHAHHYTAHPVRFNPLRRPVQRADTSPRTGAAAASSGAMALRQRCRLQLARAQQQGRRRLGVMTCRPCPICGQPIPHKPGPPAAACSPHCRAERRRRQAAARYAAVKDTAHWREVRADYLARLRARLAADPEFAAIHRAHGAAATRAWNARLQAADPERAAAMRAAKRAERAAWRRRLEADPVAWEAHKAAARAWYAALPAAERERIFNAPRRKRRPADR
jgi:hypothetical protein